MAAPRGYWEFNHNVTLGIWVRKSGAWTKVTQVYASAYQSGGSGGTRTVGYSYSGTIQLGTGIEAFGVTVDSTSGSSASVDDLAQVNWTAQGSSGGTSSALYSGSTTTITVRPK